MAPKTAKQQYFAIASAMMFFGSTAAAAIHFVVSTAAQSTAPLTEQATLQQQAQSYETILNREPNNQAALEGLMRSRLALNDPSATEPLAQLIQLNPQWQDYANLMRRLKAQQAGNDFGRNSFSGSATLDR